jgi:acyl-CoA thioester hydrolase
MTSDSKRSVAVTIRVRYFETDQMQVAHHAHYLVWFELARSAFCRSHGIDYAQMEQQGYFLPIVEAQCRYISPALYDEEITITTHLITARRRTLRMGYSVTRGETLLATGETYQIVMGPDRRPRALTDALLALFTDQPSAG